MSTSHLPTREEIDDRYKWRVDHIFPDQDAWEAAFARVEQLLEEAGKHQGRLATSAGALLQALRWLEDIGKELSRVYIYAMLRHDENTADPQNQELMGRVRTLAVRVDQATAFVRPELLSAPVETIREFVDSSPELQVYGHFLDDILRHAPHVLSQEIETILALSGEVAATPRKVFSMLNDADLKFPSITDVDGSTIEVTKGRYPVLMQRRDRRVRRDAYQAFTSTYMGVNNTLAASLDGAVRANVFYARVRNYPSALAAALFEEGIDTAVYENLVQVVNDNVGHLHRYHELRSRILGLEELYAYDLQVPLSGQGDYKVKYDEAVDIIKQAMAPLGDEYGQVLDEAFSGGWIDVYENQGKRGGAYSAGGAYGAHPYILMNWQDDLNSLFTLAHELGHAVHSYYSERHQPYIYSNYKIFVAEVASTVNEGLLVRYLLENLDDEAQKSYVLNHYIDGFRGTVFTQVMFAQFEQQIHQMVEQGQPLTAQVLNETYRRLCRQYWGPKVVVDDNAAVMWSRIPHFYYNFYVYKYATGFSAAVALTDALLTQGAEARKRYLDFLKAGGSDYPLNLLARAGVDLRSPEPIEAAMKRFSQLLDQLERDLL